jgi:dTDP-4-amino-4,6-dideoxygalactose transaminase
MDIRIPFAKPTLGPAERQAVLEALEAGSIGGNGRFTSKLREEMCTRFGVRQVIMTTSGSDALELAMMALDLGPGDEVIMPSFTFVSTANAVVRQGGRPVFADIEPDTWNIDPVQVEQHVTPKTKGIVPVHYAGQGCRMEELARIAKRHRLWVVEDAAQAVGARYDGRYLGTIGTAGCYSFHATKNVTCGEGGALLTSDEVLLRRTEVIAEKGTNRAAFLLGQVDKYTWVDVGSSFIASDILAAMVSVQLQRLDEITSRRLAIWHRFQRELEDLEKSGDIRLLRIDPRAQINGHLFAFRVTDPVRRDPILSRLRLRGIEATFHYVPLHSAPFARDRLGTSASLPVTELISHSLIRLPIYPDLMETEQDYILENVHDAFTT